MLNYELALIIAAAAIVTFILGAFIARARAAAKFERELGESRALVAALEERVKSRETTIAEITSEAQEAQDQNSVLTQENKQIFEKLTRTEEELRHSLEQTEILNKVQENFQNAFKALSADALKSNNQSFLELAKTSLESFQVAAQGDLEQRQTTIAEMVKPFKESLEKFDTRISEIEKARIGAYEGLTQQVKSLLETQTQLKSETSNLVRALGTPRVRGRWGEIQLRRVVEIAGMVDHCDFFEQESVNTEDGRLRPDLVIRLPLGKTIVVDAKAPLAGYLEALEAVDDTTRDEKFLLHAKHIRDHAVALGRKSYWDQFAPAPEFVVLFLPGEAFFSAALQQAPELIEQAVSERVLVATPTTLIALLKAVSYGWRQESLARNAEEISSLGRELYKRIGDVAHNFGALGNHLGKAVESFNKASWNMETRVFNSARKFKELSATGVEKDIQAVDSIENTPRTVQMHRTQSEVIGE